ncbi:hypothetical protein AVEN_273283-1 [Araneus ventricosus]|uniref:Uncharacterized protein n=1 Tax=Araneus ventricosus TaxID=182803 RepID=A0A4Y2RY92_ARAVE|nr:hypothetical protein AVEN_273283-1 [Araneus ventricosus]
MQTNLLFASHPFQIVILTGTGTKLGTDPKGLLRIFPDEKGEVVRHTSFKVPLFEKLKLPFFLPPSVLPFARHSDGDSFYFRSHSEEESTQSAKMLPSAQLKCWLTS